MSNIKQHHAEEPESSFFAPHAAPTGEISSPDLPQNATSPIGPVTADEPHRDEHAHHDDQRQHLDDGSFPASRTTPEQELPQDN